MDEKSGKLPYLKHLFPKLAAFLIPFFIVAAIGVYVILKTPGAADSATMGKNHLAEKLYKFKGTHFNDKGRITSIIDLLALPEGMKRKTIDLLTAFKENDIIVNYNFSDRTKYWDKCYNEYDPAFIKNAAIVLNLAEDLDGIHIRFLDKYGEFAGMYINRDTAGNYFETNIFARENLKKSTQKLDRFKAFISDTYELKSKYSVLSESQRKEKQKTDRIYGVIGIRKQIVVNSGMNFSFILKSNISAGGFNLKTSAKENGTDISQYYGRNIEALIYYIENYQQTESSPYIFIFHDEKLLAYMNLKNNHNENELKKVLSVYDIHEK